MKLIKLFYRVHILWGLLFLIAILFSCCNCDNRTCKTSKDVLPYYEALHEGEDFDSILLDEYTIKEPTLNEAIKKYAKAKEKVAIEEMDSYFAPIYLYYLKFDDSNNEFSSYVNAGHFHSRDADEQPVGFAIVDGEVILIDDCIENQKVFSFFFIQTGKKKWIKNIIKEPCLSEDDTYPVWIYKYNFKDSIGEYYDSANSPTP